MKFDLNCDLGEGEPRIRTCALMRRVTSANVACGGHAGDVESMRECVVLAKEQGVRLGAHPGWWDRVGFGRSTAYLTPDELELLLLHQVGALEKIARASGVALQHIKLHGALYHATEADECLGRRYVDTIARWWPDAIIFARSGGSVVRWGRRANVRVWEEVFADRAYHDDGSLVSREQMNALVRNPAAVSERVHLLRERGEIESVTGRCLRMRADTICLHADTPHAIQIAEVVSKMLRQKSR